MNTTPSTAYWAEKERGFVDALGKLHPGDKARLRRHAGKTLSESVDVLGVFYRLLPHGVPDRQHDRFFLVATLFPLADAGKQGNFGTTLSHMRTSSNAAGLDRRIAALLDADERQLPFRLRQLVRLAHANRVGVNWPQLLSDLRRWGWEDRPVQRAWAMAYFAKSGADAGANGEASEATADEPAEPLEADER